MDKSGGGFGERLAAARLHAGLTQEALAEEFGYADRSSVSKWENGESEPPAAVTVRLARKLRVATDWLVTGDPDAAPAWIRVPDAGGGVGEGAGEPAAAEPSPRPHRPDAASEAVLLSSLDRVTQALLLLAQADADRAVADKVRAGQPADVTRTIERIAEKLGLSSPHTAPPQAAATEQAGGTPSAPQPSARVVSGGRPGAPREAAGGGEQSRRGRA